MEVGLIKHEVFEESTWSALPPLSFQGARRADGTRPDTAGTG